MRLTEKLLAIQRKVRGLQKKEKSTQGYAYVTSSQVLTAIREAMDEVGVILTVEVVEAETRLGAMSTRSGGAVNWTGLRLKFTWHNAEDPADTLSCMWWAEGMDNAEKAAGKALTYGEKYFLLKFFHIPTDESDPDRGDSPQGYVGVSARAGYDGKGYPTRLGTLGSWLRDSYGIEKQEVRALCTRVAEELWGAAPDDWHQLTEDQVASLAQAIEGRLAGDETI